MSEFPLYLDIVHEYKPNIQQAKNLLELLYVRDSNQCTHDEFLILLNEFNQYMQNSQNKNHTAQVILSYDDFLGLLTPQMNAKQMHQLFVSQLLKDLPNNLIILYFQFLNILNPYFVSTDEVQMIMLTVLGQNEIKSYNDLLDLATQTLNDLNCIKGLIPQSKFILFLNTFGLDEDSMKENILKLQKLEVPTFSDLLKQKIKQQEILNYMLYNQQIYQIRFGSQINQQMINSIVNNVYDHFIQLNMQVNKTELLNQLTGLFVEFEVEIQKMLQNGFENEQVPEHVEQSQRKKLDQLQGCFVDFDIDQLIIAAEWEEIDLNAPIDYTESMQQTFVVPTQAPIQQNQTQSKHNMVSSLSPEGETDQMSQFMNSSAGMSLQQQPGPTLTSNSFLLTSQKFNGRLIGQKDDSVMKKLKKVLGSMK